MLAGDISEGNGCTVKASYAPIAAASTPNEKQVPAYKSLALDVRGVAEVHDDDLARDGADRPPADQVLAVEGSE